MEINEAIKMISEESKKIAHYKKQSERYIEIAKNIMQLSEQLKNIAKEIDPFANNNVIRKNNSKKDIKNELFNMLKSGTHITRNFIETTYKEISNNESAYIMTELKKIPNVVTVKEGKKVRLFYKI